MSNRMNKRQPSHVLFRRLNRRLREARDFQVRNHIGEIGQHARLSYWIPWTGIWQEPANKPPSKRMRVTCISFSITRQLREDTPLPCYLQTVQALCVDSYSQCVAFARRYLQTGYTVGFPSWILFSDELCVTQDSVLSLQNMRVWPLENPKCTCSCTLITFRRKLFGLYNRWHKLKLTK